MHLWETVGLRGGRVVGGSRRLAGHPQPSALPLAAPSPTGWQQAELGSCQASGRLEEAPGGPTGAPAFHKDGRARRQARS